jgi:8-oxo-dGTP diphosphatase
LVSSLSGRMTCVSAALKSMITGLVSGIEPTDDLGREHRRNASSWLAGTDDIFRRVKPHTPSPHLVSYFLLVDRSAGSVLLCDHRLSGLWLPTGGHVEPGEHPLGTVGREAVEELGVTAQPDAVFGDRPFFLTMTETLGPPATRHVDVSLWFALAGRVGQPYVRTSANSLRSGGGRLRNCVTRAWTGSSLTCCALCTRSGSAADRQLSALGAG